MCKLLSLQMHGTGNCYREKQGTDTAEQQWNKRKNDTKLRHGEATASTLLKRNQAARSSSPSPTFGGDDAATIVTKRF